eukprot:3914367-Lingulodinium_polyedra.AAC.1
MLRALVCPPRARTLSRGEVSWRIDCSWSVQDAAFTRDDCFINIDRQREDQSKQTTRWYCRVLALGSGICFREVVVGVVGP